MHLMFLQVMLSVINIRFPSMISPINVTFSCDLQFAPGSILVSKCVTRSNTLSVPSFKIIFICLTICLIYVIVFISYSNSCKRRHLAPKFPVLRSRSVIFLHHLQQNVQLSRFNGYLSRNSPLLKTI